MYLTTLGNDRRQLRVANERLTPAVRRGSLAVSSPLSDLKPQHLATGVQVGRRERDTGRRQVRRRDLAAVFRFRYSSPSLSDSAGTRRGPIR